MEKLIFDEINEEIENLNIKENLKKELYYFNETIETIINKGSNFKFDILIDNMSKENINILLEYTTNILEKYQIYTEFIKYRNELKNLDEIKNSVIVIDDFSIFENRILNSWKSQEQFDNFFTEVKLNNNMIILTCTNKIENHFKDINSLIFNPKLCIHLKEKETNKELYEKLINKYQNKNIDCRLSYKTFNKIISLLDDNYYVKHFDIVDYIYDYSLKKIILDNNNIINNKTFEDIIIEKEKNAKKQDKKSLDNLVGLNNIKEELDSLYNYLEFSKKTKINKELYLNLFLLGNPGTGKTTVARMYVKKLYDLGYIKNNTLIEITPNDLMGEYVGQTKTKARKIFDSAKGGVLFIDEAYLIEEDIQKNISFMKEALVELLKYLEDPKNIVIFAGYKEKMRKLYNTNPGIKSRIYKEIIFKDYSSDELYEILISDLKEKGLKIDNKSKDKIIKHIEYLKKDINFGNARSIKQLSQKMIMNHANKKLKKETLVLDSSDLPNKEKNNIVRMGFSIYD